MNIKDAVDFFKQFYGWKSDSIWVLTKESFMPDDLHRMGICNIIRNSDADPGTVFMDSPDIKTCSLAFSLWAYTYVNGKCLYYNAHHRGNIGDVISDVQFHLANEDNDNTTSNFDLSNAASKTQKWFTNLWFSENIPITFIKSADNPLLLNTGFMTGSFEDALYMHSIRHMFNLNTIPAPMHNKGIAQ